MDKEDEEYIFYMYKIYIMEYYSATKKTERFCDNMHKSRGYCAKWIKSDRERQIPYNLTYMWILKYKTNKWKEIKSFIDTENKQEVASGKGCEIWEGD